MHFRSQIIPPLRRTAKRAQKNLRSLRIFALAGLRGLPFARARLHLPRNQPFHLRSSPADGVAVREVDPEETFTRTLPHMPGEPVCHPFFPSQRSRTVPASFVAEFQGGRIWCDSHSAVLTADGRLVPELSKDMWGHRQHHTYLRLSFPPLRFLPGRTLSLITPEAMGNYHHWMLDLLPRIGVVERGGWDLRAFDHILVKARGHAFQHETLRRAGFDPAKIIWVRDTDHFQAESLVVPSFHADSLIVNRADFRYVRGLFLPEHLPAPSGRRLYLSRRDAAHRRIVNAAELDPIIRDHGFEEVSMSNLSVAEQAALISGASVLLGPNGAAFANLVFAHPAAKVIDFYAPGWVVGYSWMICDSLNLDYTAIVGRGVRPPAALPPREITQDIELDPAILKLALARLPSR
jgi:capsular polysaccharide biosynthesis protein